VSHRNARLTVHGRLLLVERVQAWCPVARSGAAPGDRVYVCAARRGFAGQVGFV
jgi:hypothetical protein